MQQQHIIETASFDLDLDESLDVARIDGELNRVVQAELLPVVEQIFDEFGAGAKPIHLDVLEVDMGTLGFDGSWAQARERLAGALRTALARARPGSTESARRADPAEDQAAETTGGDGSRIRGDALYEALRGRLLDQAMTERSGVESPDAGTLDVEALDVEALDVEALDVEALDVEALVATLLAEHPQLLRQLFRELRSAAAPMDPARMLLSGAGWRGLVHAFLSLTTPGAAATPSTFMQAIETFATRAGSSRDYYAEVFACLVRDELVDVEAISARTQAEPETGTRAPPRADSESTLRGDALYNALRGRLLGRSGTDGSQPASPDVEARHVETPDVETPDVGTLDVETLVAALLAEHPQLLQRFYRELQRTAVPVDRALALLSGAEWRALVHGFLSLTSPGEGATRSQFIQAIETFAARARSLRSYYAGILDHLVRDEPVDLEAISAGVQAEPENATQAPIPADDESRFRGYSLYEALLRHLLGQGASSDRDMQSPFVEARDAGTLDPETLDVERLVAALLAEHPQQLQRLYRELQSTAVPVDPAMVLLPGAALRALVRGFLSLTAPTEAATPSRFMQAIETFATRARSSRGYYAQVLACLVRDELVDLEAIAASTKSGQHPETESVLAQTGYRPGTPRGADAGTDASMPADAALVQLGRYLRDGSLAPDMDAAMLARGVQGTLGQAPERLHQLLQEVLIDEASEYRLVALLPEQALARVLFMLAPAVYPALREVAETLAVAALGPGTGIAAARVSTLKWRFALHYLLHRRGQTPEGVLHAAAFVRAFTAELALHSRLADATALREQLARQLALDMLPAARDMQLRVLQALRAEPTVQPTIEAAVKATARTTGQSSRHGLDVAGPAAPKERTHIANAGQVLASPYLPRLFERLALIHQGTFNSRDAAERAAWLLQFMVDGATKYPRQPIPLNRLLCGLSGPPQPGRDGVPLRPEELEAVESLLQAMIQHWSAIGNTTVAGLRESFLQREGVLVNGADAWQLSVQPRAYDMLLDRLPWGFSMIKHPWMERVLQVTWR